MSVITSIKSIPIQTWREANRSAENHEILVHYLCLGTYKHKSPLFQKLQVETRFIHIDKAWFHFEYLFKNLRQMHPALYYSGVADEIHTRYQVGIQKMGVFTALRVLDYFCEKMIPVLRESPYIQQETLQNTLQTYPLQQVSYPSKRSLFIPAYPGFQNILDLFVQHYTAYFAEQKEQFKYWHTDAYDAALHAYVLDSYRKYMLFLHRELLTERKTVLKRVEKVFLIVSA